MAEQDEFEIFDPETVEDGDELFFVFQTEENKVEFNASPRVGYEKLSTRFTDKTTSGIENSESVFDGDVEEEFTIEGTLPEVL